MREPRIRNTRHLLLALVMTSVVTVACAGGGGGNTMTQYPYGDDPLQHAVLLLPPGDGPHRVVVLIHGGFWRAGYRTDLMDALAADLLDRGVAVWNLEYRAVGDEGAGYPGTLLDVAAGVDLLTTVPHDLDLDTVTAVGHSAGGHLALWLASRERLEPGDPGFGPAVVPSVVVAQAAVADLIIAAEQRLGNGATQDLLGGEPHEVPEHYRVANPVGVSARVIAVHGALDDIVPPSQSDLLVGAQLITEPDADHFTVLDPEHSLWTRTLEALDIG